MEPLPFAGFNAKPSPWGFSWTTDSVAHGPTAYRKPASATGRGPPRMNNYSPALAPQQNQPNIQYINMPAALLTSLKKDKKPFTYTPGGVNLSEVLNARLQKRIERKKKNSVGAMSPPLPQDHGDDLPRFEPPRQVIVTPTYNTPLDMYSMENAIEALEIQAGLTVADKGLSSQSRSATLPRNHTFHYDEKDFDSNRNVAQSKAFKVLQIITDTEEEPQTNFSPNKHQHQEEMRFTGIREKAIPSKFFHQLQRITGTEEDDALENNSPREMERIGVPPTKLFDQSTQNQGFQHRPFAVQNHDRHHQVTSGQRTAHAQQMNGPMLKRPAAFLPAKTFATDSNRYNRVKPVKPPFLCNGPVRSFNHSEGTDF